VGWMLKRRNDSNRGVEASTSSCCSVERPRFGAFCLVDLLGL
jgi:hypothetical protein